MLFFCGILKITGGETMAANNYTSPLSERYPSKEMQFLFSPDMKFRTWDGCGSP